MTAVNKKEKEMERMKEVPNRKKINNGKKKKKKWKGEWMRKRE